MADIPTPPRINHTRARWLFNILAVLFILGLGGFIIYKTIF